MRFEHVVAEHGAEIVSERGKIGRFKLGEGPLIDLDDANALGALRHLCRIGFEMGTQIGHALSAPGVKQRTHAAEILQP